MTRAPALVAGGLHPNIVWAMFWYYLGALASALVLAFMGARHRTLETRLRKLKGPRVFEYQSGWKQVPATCQLCGWTGTLEQAESEHFDDLMEQHCPKCIGKHGSKLALISYPLVTMQPSKQNAKPAESRTPPTEAPRAFKTKQEAEEYSRRVAQAMCDSLNKVTRDKQ